MNHVPEGYHSVTPSLTVRDAPAAIDFYTKAFDAVESFRMPEAKSGQIMHAEFRIGNSTLMISDEYPDWGAVAPEIGKGALFMIYVPDADAAFAQATAAGATAIMPPADQFWGDRCGRVADPFGYRWTLAQKVKDVPAEEVTRLAAEWEG